MLLLAFGIANLGAAEDKYPLTPAEKAAYTQLAQEGHPVKARETAEAVLQTNPNSFIAYYVIGAVYAHVEGSLPKAYYYLKKAQGLIESRYGQDVPEDGPWLWHNRVIRELINVTAEMDRYEEELGFLALHDRLFTPPLTASWGWPLMKLGRMEEARSKVEEALKSKQPETIVNALNTLGAIEIEIEHPEASLQVFMRLIDLVRHNRWDLSPTYLSNAAESATSLLRFDEAEKLLIEASRHFQYGTYSNPWRLLTMLYMREGRIPEAIAAVRELQAWSYQNQASLQQQTWAGRQLLTAAVILESGYAEEALSILKRAQNRPDRRGSTSEHPDQSEAGFLVLYREALKVHRERLAETASWAPLVERPRLWLASLADAVEIWTAGRRAAALILGNNRLDWSLRPTAPDFIDILESTRIALNEVLGSGIVGTEAQRLLLRKDSIGLREAPYLLLTSGYGELLRGNERAASDLLARAARDLPPAEVLLRAQAEALLGRAWEDSGNLSEALAHYQQAMQKAPSVFRTFGLVLPCRILNGNDAASRKAAGFLAASPRFKNSKQGFSVSVTSSGNLLSGMLAGPDGSVLCQVRTPLSQDPAVAARLFCQEFHRKAFAPKIDLSQTDIISLEGSNLTGEGVREQIRTLFVPPGKPISR